VNNAFLVMNCVEWLLVFILSEVKEMFVREILIDSKLGMHAFIVDETQDLAYLANNLWLWREYKNCHDSVPCDYFGNSYPQYFVRKNNQRADHRR